MAKEPRHEEPRGRCAEAARRPWNASTRLVGKSPADGSDADERANDGGTTRAGRCHHRRSAGEHAQGPRRCTSPACQTQCGAGVTAVAAQLTQADAVAPARQDGGKRRGEEAAGAASRVENTPRAMIERAFDAAFATAMTQDAPPSPLGQSSSADCAPPPLDAVLRQADAVAAQWRVQYAQRRAQKERDTARTSDVQRAMRAARVEYEQRKLAVQSLRARVEREVAFLQASAADLARREALLDEAFDGYTQWVQRALLARPPPSAHAG